MDAILKEINAVLGVVGSFVCRADGTLAARAMPDSFDDTRLLTAARIARQTFDALDTSGQRVNETDLTFARGRLLMKNLRGGMLLIVCARNTNLPLLNLTANVAAKKIAAELKTPTETIAPAPRVATPASAPVASPVIASSPLFDELEQEAKRVLTAAQQARVVMRVMDALAVWLTCPDARASLIEPTSKQLVFAAHAYRAEAISELFAQLHYQPKTQLNTFYAGKRLYFEDVTRKLAAEIHLGAFDLYHTLDLNNALAGEGVALAPTTLLLSRLQIVEMTDTPLRELCALLLTYDWSINAETNKFDASYVTRLCTEDWGWFRTLTLNLDRVIAFAPRLLNTSNANLVVERAQRIKTGIEQAPKGLRWQMRARIGDSMRWFEPPANPDLSSNQTPVEIRYGD